MLLKVIKLPFRKCESFITCLSLFEGSWKGWHEKINNKNFHKKTSLMFDEKAFGRNRYIHSVLIPNYIPFLSRHPLNQLSQILPHYTYLKLFHIINYISQSVLYHHTVDFLCLQFVTYRTWHKQQCVAYVKNDWSNRKSSHGDKNPQRFLFIWESI